MDGLLTYPIPGPDNTITERKFICKSYALGKVLKHLGITITELLGDSYFSPDSNAGDFSDTVILFMYHSAVFAAEKEGEKVDFKLADCYDWVDATGGFNGELYTQFSNIALMSLGYKQAEPGEEPTKPEKKSKVKK